MPLSKPSVPACHAANRRKARSELISYATSLNGRVIDGGFAIGKMISHGMYGCVCKGEHLESETKVAVKVAPSNDISMAHEIRLLQLVTECRWIATPIAWGEIDSKYQFLALSLEGKPLHCIMRFWKPASPMIPTVLNVLIECIRGLEYLHAKGIIHRDLHLGNLLLPETKGKGKIVIVDMGLSAIREPDGKFTCAKDVRELTHVFHTPYDVMHGSPHCEADDLIQLIYLALRFRSASVVKEKSLQQFHRYKKELRDDPESAIPWDHDFLLPFAKAVYKQKRYDEKQMSVKPKYSEIKEAIKKTLGFDPSRGIY